MILLDTGPLVALLDRRESHHHWASEIVSGLQESLWTCGAVLSEVSFLVGSHPQVVTRLSHLVRNDVVRSVEETSLLWSRALALIARYSNIPMSFADACLVALAEQRAEARIFTLDRDFLIYRRNEQQPLTLLAPFVA